MKHFKLLMAIICILLAVQSLTAKDNKKKKGKKLVAKIATKPINVPLTNAGFESDASKLKDKKWDGWRWSNSAVAVRSTDAHSGKAALFVKKHNQNCLTHPIEFSGCSNKIVKVSFWAKGNGTIIVMLLGTSSKLVLTNPKRKKALFVLRPERYSKYTSYFKMSKNSDKLGKLAFLARTPYHSYNSGQFLLDDIKIEILDQLPEASPHTIANYDIKKKVPLPPQYFTGYGAIPKGMVNIAPYANISTTPFALGAQRMVDGYLGSASSKCEMVELSFKKAQKISSIRIGMPSSQIYILADKKGNGKYVPLAIDNNGWAFGYWGRPSWPWYKKNFKKPVKVRSIRIYNPGYEIQLLSSKSNAAALVKANREKMPNIPEMAIASPVSTPEAAPDDKVLVGFTVEPWMFGSEREIDKKDNPKRPLKEWDGWKKLVADYKDLKANFILLFPPQTWIKPAKGEPRKGTYPSAVLWPSNAWYRSCQKNVLAEMCKSAHENNIKIFPVFRNYALKEGGTVSELNKEMAEAGVDAIPSVHDEQAFVIHGVGKIRTVKSNMSEKQKKRVERDNKRYSDEVASFEKLNALRMKEAKALPEPERSIKVFNSYVNYPSRPSDPGYRRLVLMRYNKIAEKVAANTAAARAVKPNIKTFAAFTCTEELGCNRIGRFSENDIGGFKGGIDIVGGTSGYFTLNDKLGWPKASYYTQVYRACSPKRESMHTMCLSWGFGFFGSAKTNPLCEDVYPPVAYIGNTLAAVFNKATAVDFWRYNFMDMVPRGREAIRDAFHMTDTACAWGAKKATIPRDILMLRSRASEDWWFLNVKHNKSDINSISKGVDQAQWLGDLLVRNAFPFEMYWQDQPQSYEPVIDKFKVIVLSFPYSVSDQELKLLEKAASANIPIIAIGAKGETDAFGDKRKIPALDALIKAGKIQFFDKDIQRDGNLRSTKNELISLLEKDIGKGKRSLSLKRYKDNSVQAAMLEVKPDEKLVTLINWGNSDAIVDVGMALPAHKDYKLSYRGRKGTSRMSIGGRKLLSEVDLRQFRVKMKEGEVGILRIFR